MKIFFSIILNASIFYFIRLLLNTQEYLNEHWQNAVIVWNLEWQTYLIAWIILWVLNITVKPILKILGFPISLFLNFIVVLVINIILLGLLDKIINKMLLIEGIQYEIIWTTNFIIAVAIFTFLNIIYSILFNKK